MILRQTQNISLCLSEIFQCNHMTYPKGEIGNHKAVPLSFRIEMMTSVLR